MALQFFWTAKMPQGIAVTHADLVPKGRETNIGGSKTGAFLIVLTILCGVSCFVLCIMAEASRSEVTWMSRSTRDHGKAEHVCVYSGNGKTPLLYAVGAFVALAAAMIVEHSCLLIAMSRTPPPLLVTWEPDFGYAKNLTVRATVFFILTCICFAAGETLLLMGIAVESGHLENWSRPKLSCIAIRRGLFTAAGILALATVFLAACLYLAVVQTLQKIVEIENARREAFENTAIYTYPPRSPRHVEALAREDPVRRDSFVSHQVLIKQCY